MIKLYRKDQIKLIAKSGAIAEFTLKQILKNVRAGLATIELDRIARRIIAAREGIPAFVNYNGFKHAICISVNDEVVHGIPSSRILKQGDVVSIDLGVKYNGYYSDTAATVVIGKPSSKIKNLVRGTKEALKKAIKKARPGLRVGDIEFEIGKQLKAHGLSPVTSLTGHGIGRKLHEEPIIRCAGPAGKGPVIQEGMVLAIEPMATDGSSDLYTEKDGFTLKTKDGSLASHFEHTVYVAKNGPKILTGRI